MVDDKTSLSLPVHGMRDMRRFFFRISCCFYLSTLHSSTSILTCLLALGGDIMSKSISSTHKIPFGGLFKSFPSCSSPRKKDILRYKHDDDVRFQLQQKCRERRYNTTYGRSMKNLYIFFPSQLQLHLSSLLSTVLMRLLSYQVSGIIWVFAALCVGWGHDK